MRKAVIVICSIIVSVTVLIVGFYPIIENGQVTVKTPNSIMITTDKTEYVVGESIEITMKNVGGNTLESNSTPVGFTIYDEHDNQIKTWIGSTGAIGRFDPGEEVRHVWDQKEDYSQEQVKSGIYRIKADNFYVFGGQGNYDGPIHEFKILDG